ncbi:MAG: hypothetical protein AAF495_23855 [Pseudomonadota bacterium]
MDGEPASAHPEKLDGEPNEGAVRQALDRVISVPPLSRSKRLSRFLSYIVDETLAGRSETINGYSIGVDVFHKPESFDPTTDSIVRVEAGRLRQRLAEFYREAGAEDPIEICLPKGSYVPSFQMRRAPQVAPMVPEVHGHRGPSIAVMPFQNYGADKDDQYFADGLTEETIANLARFKDLFVFSRSTTAKLAREGASVQDLRAQLGVDFVLESSVRRSSQAVRVTVQLIDGASDGHVFAEKFDRPCTPESVFEIQDEIARLVAGRIADRYGPLGRYLARASRSGRSKKWETYLWIIRFHDYYAKHLPDLHLEVRHGLEAALETDSESSDACAALAAIYLDEYRFHLNERDDFPALDRALETVLRAATYDPDSAMAYQFMALVHYHRREFVDFNIAARRALELNPGHADVLADIGHCYALSGEWDRGLELIGRALEISPVHPGWYHHVPALRKLLDGDAAAAILTMKKNPMLGFSWYHALMASFYAHAGNHTGAAEEVQALSEASPAFAAKAWDECRIWTSDEELIAAISDGWQKAGLPID